MLHNIFGHNIYIKEFKDLDKFEPYKKLFTKQLINLGHCYVDDSAWPPDIQKKGNSVTSVSNVKDFQGLVGYSLLKKILEPAILEARSYMFKNIEIKKVDLFRTWHNINYKNSYVLSHSHIKRSDQALHPNKRMQVCILYLEAPEGSGKLAIIDDDSENLRCADFDQDKVHYITVNPNMLICHDSDVNHVVSEHLSDERRICIIFEYILTIE